MSTLLVTGASGYLGSELCRRAAVAGWHVVGTTFTRSGPAGVAWLVALDIRDAHAVDRVVAKTAPDAVVHTAYRQDGRDAAAINVDGALHVAAAAFRVRARLVHLSTDVVFRGGLGRALREGDPLDPMTEYGSTKARAEMAVATQHPGALLVRTSLIYGGPGFAPSTHERLAVAAARGENDVRFFDDEVRTPVQVGDLAEALLELVVHDIAGPLHVAGAEAVTRLDFARLAASARGENSAALRAARRPADRPGDCALDCSCAQRLLSTSLRGVRAVLGSA